MVAMVAILKLLYLVYPLFLLSEFNVLIDMTKLIIHDLELKFKDLHI